jgi:hypothetical protein
MKKYFILGLGVILCGFAASASPLAVVKKKVASGPVRVIVSNDLENDVKVLRVQLANHSPLQLNKPNKQGVVADQRYSEPFGKTTLTWTTTTTTHTADIDRPPHGASIGIDDTMILYIYGDHLYGDLNKQYEWNF